MSCNGNSEAEKEQKEADRMIAKAMEQAAKLQAEAEANAEALKNEAEEKALTSVEETQTKRMHKAKAETTAKLQIDNIKQKANKSLSKYNGFYVNDKHSGLGALIFTDGKLAFFDCQDFKNTYKNEEYIIESITDDGFFNITGKYYKDRNDRVYVKKTVLREGQPKIKNSVCISIERLGNVFNRYETFRDFMMSDRNWNYPLDELISDVKSEYNRSDSEIEKALNRTDFYECKAYQDADFYGKRFLYSAVLESIISMN